MAQFQFIVFLAVFLTVCSASNVWQDLLTLDCNGGITFMGTNPLLQAKIELENVEGLFQWFTDRLYERYSTCHDCSASKTEFLYNFDIASVEYWLNQIQATPQNSTSCPNSPFKPISQSFLGLPHVTFGPFVDNGCTLNNYEMGKPCLLLITPDLDSTGIKLQFALQKCSSSNWPYISLSCSGDGCKTFGAPCNSDSECSGQQTCYSVSGNGTDSFLSNILNQMKLFDSNDSTECYSGKSYFVDLISLVRLKAFGLTTPYNFGVPSAFRICLQENLLELNDTKQFGCTQNNNDIECTKITTWNGILDDGTSVTASSRMSGQTDVPFATSPPTIPPDSNKPAVTLLYADCSNEYGILPALDGLGAGSIIVLNSLLPQLSNNDSMSTNLAYIALAVVAVSAKLKIPPLNILTNKFWGETFIVEACRAAALKSSLSINAFKVRFGWIPDNLLYTFTSPVTTLTNPGPTMSDWSLPDGGTKLTMPSSCSYDTWQSTGLCSFEYSGLQSILQSDITLRFVLQSCSGFNVPKLTVDCSGTSCPLISTVVQCSTSSDCPTGTVCWDSSSVLNSENQPMDAFGEILSLGRSLSSTCTGKSNYVSDVESLLNYLLGDSGTGDVKFCFWNVSHIIQRLMPGGDLNITAWVNDQFLVNGETAKNAFIANWVPAFAPPQPSSVTFIVTLSSLPSNLNTLQTTLVNILVDSGFTPGTFSVTVTSSKKRSATVKFQVTSSDPQVTSSIASQVQDNTTSLSKQITTQIGTPSSVSTSGLTGPTSSPSASPSSAVQLVAGVGIMMILFVVAMITI